MLGFIAKHIVKFILLMFAVSIVCFLLVSFSPVDPVQANIGQTAYLNMSEAKRLALANYWGANTPIWERYAQWLGAVFQGDMGISLRFNAPVTQVIATRFINTAALMTVAWVVSGVFGFIMGVIAGVKQGSWLDSLIKAYSFLLASTPTFWLALIALMVFSVWLGIFPIGFGMPIGANPADVSLLDALHHLALPALTLSVVGVANIAMHTREKTVDVMNSSYVRFAKARGCKTSQIVKDHVLRNVSLPAITLQFAAISEIFGGSVLVEQVFSYPGLGQAAITAGLGGDAALLVGIAVVSAALVFAGNLTASILYQIVDPQMRKTNSKQKAK